MGKAELTCRSSVALGGGGRKKERLNGRLWGFFLVKKSLNIIPGLFRAIFMSLFFHNVLPEPAPKSRFQVASIHLAHNQLSPISKFRRFDSLCSPFAPLPSRNHPFLSHSGQTLQSRFPRHYWLILFWLEDAAVGRNGRVVFTRPSGSS